MNKYIKKGQTKDDAFNSMVKQTLYSYEDAYSIVYRDKEIRYEVYREPKEIHNNFMVTLNNFDGDLPTAIRYFRRHIESPDDMDHVKGFGRTNKNPISNFEIHWNGDYGEYVPISSIRSTLFHYIRYTVGDDDALQFMMETFPEKIHRCLECDVIVKIDYSNFELKREMNTFCCREHYDIYREKNYNSYFFFTEEQKEKASKRMKKAIREGTFTPNCTNSWTNSEPIIIDGKKYKSSWESLYKRLNGDSIEYETIRIPYVGKTGKSHSYIVDFHDVETDTLYEIKPKSQLSRELNVIKVEAAREWAAERGMTYVIVTEDWFKDNIDRLHALCYDELDRKEVNAINKFQKEIDNEQRRSENQKH